MWVYDAAKPMHLFKYCSKKASTIITIMVLPAVKVWIGCTHTLSHTPKRLPDLMCTMWTDG